MTSNRLARIAYAERNPARTTSVLRIVMNRTARAVHWQLGRAHSTHRGSMYYCMAKVEGKVSWTRGTETQLVPRDDRKTLGQLRT